MIWCSAAIGIILLYLPFFREKQYVTGEPASLGLLDEIVTTLKQGFPHIWRQRHFWLYRTVSLPFMSLCFWDR